MYERWTAVRGLWTRSNGYFSDEELDVVQNRENEDRSLTDKR